MTQSHLTTFTTSPQPSGQIQTSHLPPEVSTSPECQQTCRARMQHRVLSRSRKPVVSAINHAGIILTRSSEMQGDEGKQPERFRYDAK